MAKRSSNHSLDRFLLVTVLGWFYREYYIFRGNERELLQWERSWSGAERELWMERSVIHEAILVRAMNICLQEADEALLRGRAGTGNDAAEVEEERYRKLKELMRLQYAGEAECRALRQLAADQEDVGIQRGTVKNLLDELVTLEERLQAMPDQSLADWLAVRVQGFRLRKVRDGKLVKKKKKNGQEEVQERGAVYHIEPVGQPAQQMAAVQAAYYPFLDRIHTDQVLDLLGLTSLRRQSLGEINEEKTTPASGEKRQGLAEELEQALTAVETARQYYGEENAPEKLFWYELTYHSWQWRDGELTLCPRQEAIPLLPWRVVYSNGYFYLCGLRLDLDPSVTGALGEQPVFSNLRLDRIRGLHRVDPGESDVSYTMRQLHRIVEQMYPLDSRSPLEYRDTSTIMYSGSQETLRIDCDPALMNSAVDDFGRENLSLEDDSLPDGRVRVRVEGAVWEGAKQWLLQHAQRCCLSDTPDQAGRRREMAEILRRAAAGYDT